jgi:hypothetical protein
MIAAIKRLEFEANTKPIHVTFSYRYQRFSSFTIFSVHLFPSSKQAGIIIFGFYFIVGKCLVIGSAELTEEEKKMLDET